jgi:hypothetical protein
MVNPRWENLFTHAASTGRSYVPSHSHGPEGVGSHGNSTCAVSTPDHRHRSIGGTALKSSVAAQFGFVPISLGDVVGITDSSSHFWTSPPRRSTDCWVKSRACTVPSGVCPEWGVRLAGTSMGQRPSAESRACGQAFWGIVWLIIGRFGGERREVLQVDPYGDVISSGRTRSN